MSKNIMFLKTEYFTNDYRIAFVLTEKNDWFCAIIDSESNIINDFGLKYKYIEYARNCSKFICCYECCELNISCEYSTDCNIEFSPKGIPDLYDCDFNFVIHGNVEKIDDKYIYFHREKLGLALLDGTIVLIDQYESIEIGSSDQFIVNVKDNSTKKRIYGVITAKGEEIIPLEYNYISSKSSSLYECKIYNEDYSSTFWINEKGEIVHKGDAEILQEDTLLIRQQGRSGIKNSQGKWIASIIYDDIVAFKQGYFVLCNHRLGILSLEGEVMVSTCYVSIEYVLRDNDEQIIKDCHSKEWTGYCRDCQFDTRNLNKDNCKKYIVKVSSNRIFVNHVASLKYC